MSYINYGLTETPFVEESFAYKMQGREEEWNKIESIINTSLTGSSNRTILIQGDYGFGKTLTLGRIFQGLQNDEFENCKKTLVIQIQLVGIEAESKTALPFVTKVFNAIGFDALQKIMKKIDFETITGINPILKKILLGIKEGNENAFQWLIGESLTSEEKKELKIVKKLESKDSMNIYYDFLRILTKAKIENIVIIMDEFEYVVNQLSTKQMTSTLKMFSEIYDMFVKSQTDQRGSIAKTIFVIGITPMGWEHLIKLEKSLIRTGGAGITPWMERIRPEQSIVNLEPLTQEGIFNMLRDRITDKRTETSKPKYDTEPFLNPEFFEIIYKASNGVPRMALRMCDLVFEKAIDEGVKEINGDYTEKTLDDSNLLPYSS